MFRREDFEFTLLRPNGLFGKVYDAVLVATGQRVCVEALDLGLAEGAPGRMAADRRAELLEALGAHCAQLASMEEHPNVAKVLGVLRGPSRDVPASTDPYMECGIVTAAHQGTLEWWNQQESRPQIALSKCMADVAAGLAHLHAQLPCVLHRLVTPRTVVVALDNDGLPRLQLACPGVAPLVARADETVRCTGDWLLQYAAPEVLSGYRFDGKADVYSAGLTLAAPCAGPAASSKIAHQRVVREALCALQDTAPLLAAQLRAWCARAAEDRPTAAEACAALRAMDADGITE